MPQSDPRSIPLHLVEASIPNPETELKHGVKQQGQAKIARSPVEFALGPPLAKPPWIRVRLSSSANVNALKARFRHAQLATVCEHASCPNIHECYAHGTASFMILGEICTRRCSFCDVAHGRPLAPNPHEPEQLGHTVASMGLQYVVITSVDRDDLLDGGASHFVACIAAVRRHAPSTRIEILTPDFRGKGRRERALTILAQQPPDVFNHNIETVPHLYRTVRPGADYRWSLALLAEFKAQHPTIPTKSGLMLGLGETREQVEQTLNDLRAHAVDMVTIGQYLQPSCHHHPVIRYWSPDEFKQFEEMGYVLGFSHVASGPMVRSSYHADLQAKGAGVAVLESSPV